MKQNLKPFLPNFFNNLWPMCDESFLWKLFLQQFEFLRACKKLPKYVFSIFALLPSGRLCDSWFENRFEFQICLRSWKDYHLLIINDINDILMFKPFNVSHILLNKRNFEFQLTQQAVLSPSEPITSGMKMEHPPGTFLWKS